MALALGRPVGELLRVMSLRELQSWARYEHEVAPVGPERLEVMLARALYVVSRAHGSKVRLDQLLPPWLSRARPLLGPKAFLEKLLAIKQARGR